MLYEKLNSYVKNHLSEIVLLVKYSDASIITANERACYYYGYSQDELEKMNYCQLNHSTLEENLKLFDEIKSQQTSRYTEKHYPKNETITDVEILALPFEINGNDVLALFIKDITVLKKREEDFLNFKKAVDTSGDIVFITDRNGIINYINQTFTKVYGYTKEEILGLHTPRILKSGKLLQADYEKIWHKLINKDIFKGEFINKTKQGRYVHIEASANPILTEEGEINGFLAIQKDITEKKYVEKKLIENEHRFRQIFNEGPLGMAIVGFDMVFINVNQRLTEITGFSRDELVNLSVEEIPSPDDKAFDMQQIKSIAKGDIPFYNLKKRYYKKNRDVVWVSITITVIKDNSENPQYFLAMIEDITEQIISQENLRLSESRYRILASNIPNSFVMLFNSEEKIILAEGPELRKINKLNKNLEGRYLVEIIPPYDYNVAIPYIKTVFEGIESSYELDSINGYYEVQMIPIRDDEGLVQKGMVVAQNITERKNNEKKLKELLASKDKFFSIIAHDLKSPFNSLIGFSDFLVSDYETMPPEQIKMFATNINKSARGVFALLENLLQWSMVQTGRLEFSPSKFKICALTGEIQSIYVISALRKNIVLNFACAEDMQVFADRNMVFTILRNLISNSIKFTKPGGEVGILFEEEENHIKIIVYDTGIGMKKEDIDNLFLMDKNVTRKGTDNETGTGLGLILCKEFIEINNGTFAIESELNKGTKFIFNLPKN